MNDPVEQLYQNNEEFIKAAAWKLVRSARINDENDVDDYVQELTIAAYKSLHKWDESGGLPVTYFCYNAMRNRLSDLHRLRKHRDRRQPLKLLKLYSINITDVSMEYVYDGDFEQVQVNDDNQQNTNSDDCI